jgi:hypothetical protein
MRRNPDYRGSRYSNRNTFERQREGQSFNNFAGQKRDRLGEEPKIPTNHGKSGQGANHTRVEPLKVPARQKADGI